MPPRGGSGPPVRRRRPTGRLGASANQKSSAAGNKPVSRGAQAAARISAQGEMRFRRDVTRLHALGPRAIYQLLTELAARRLLRTEIEQLVGYYAQLDPEIVRAVEADRLPPLPLPRAVQRRGGP